MKKKHIVSHIVTMSYSTVVFHDVSVSFADSAMVGIPHGIRQAPSILIYLDERSIHLVTMVTGHDRSPTQGFEGSSSWIPVCLHQQKLTLLGRTFTRWYP